MRTVRAGRWGVGVLVAEAGFTKAAAELVVVGAGG